MAEGVAWVPTVRLGEVSSAAAASPAAGILALRRARQPTFTQLRAVFRRGLLPAFVQLLSLRGG